jgi:hypothetical protein
MPDGLALPLIALLAAGLIGLALVWPQGEGSRSPPPFGRPVQAAPPLAAALRGPLAPATH